MKDVSMRSQVRCRDRGRLHRQFRATFPGVCAIFGACALLAFGPASAQPSTSPATNVLMVGVAMTQPFAVDAWSARLAQLDPLRPMDYLELAEEVADQAQHDEERALARQLFGLAGALDTARLGRSAMLAIAQLTPVGSERVRALAAAELVGGRGALPQTDSLREATVAGAIEGRDSAATEALARSFSFYRRGDGRRALMALRQSGADALLDAIGAQLPGGAEAYRQECRAMRAGGVTPFDGEMIQRQLEIELALRRGAARELSLDLALRGDAPLLEIDLSDPRALWGVDPARAWWRNGEWREEG